MIVMTEVKKVIEPRIQELSSLEDLNELVPGATVNVHGRSPMRYHAFTGTEICLVGRAGDAIEWIYARVKDLTLRDKSLVLNNPRIVICPTGADYSNLRFYNESNRLLKEAGL